MAPLKPRQNHSLTPSTPRLRKGPSAKPVPVTTSIDPKVFDELFAGVVIIFFLAVVFWKTGKFIRSFNRHKVLAEGKTTTARYARTWYGWVPLETHERNKEIFTQIFAWIGEWTAWKTTRTDYRWVWWDPDQKALEERRRNRRLLAWLPECFKSYDFPTADEIWNPRPPTQCHGALSDDRPQSVQLPESPRTGRIDGSPLSQQCFADNEDAEQPSIFPSISSLPPRLDTCTPHERRAARFLSNKRPVKQPSKICNKFQSPSNLRSASQTSMELLSQLSIDMDRVSCRDPSFSGPSSFRTAKSDDCSQSHETPKVSIGMIDLKPHQHHNLRKYRVWSTQMQVKTKSPGLHDLRDSSGPPGTPMTSLLASFLSEQSACDVISNQPIKRGLLKNSIGRLSVAFNRDRIANQAHLAGEQLSTWGKPKYDTAPTRPHFSINTSPKGGKRLNHPWHSLRETEQPYHTRNALCGLWPFAENIETSPIFDDVPKSVLKGAQIPSAELSDWEVRLIDGVDRKLVWIFNEFTPGQKPYHFACLANHWLNRETWLVIDPISRVPQDSRRQWGDPRFNVPYPDPCLDRRPKYPLAVHKRANTRRIDSWRAAVNRQRRVSGVHDILHPVELYEDSCEEPPDGKIDPASWILPKPPQGFERSTRQKNAWYEGGAGWQEKLEDWQQVRRGYRLHKALHEGRVNRNYVKGLAADIGRRCRTVSSKLIPEIQQTRRPSQPIL
ncbi:uncharacterized protein N7498_009648 [Penicillium cinerascens]|uniref:Uncharacterized protein n=1 Tax=Penicillium cinerascens TaxID=70096 RepID=A0A9W9J4V9_9EURO|nr:uncharacterized protein N7498_009648 [Penicillium cinerascens]KAJ5190663.1 hypothetical protein N7498_009648 [Penicillium cinerascens]